MKRPIDELLIAIALLAMVTVTGYQIVARVFLHVPTSWSVEVGRILFLIIVFIGSISLMRTEKHLRVATLIDRLPSRIKNTVVFVSRCLVVFFLCLVCCGAYKNTLSGWKIIIPTTGWIRTGHLYLIILVSSVGMIYYQLKHIIRSWGKNI